MPGETGLSNHFLVRPVLVDEASPVVTGQGSEEFWMGGQLLHLFENDRQSMDCWDCQHQKLFAEKQIEGIQGWEAPEGVDQVDHLDEIEEHKPGDDVDDSLFADYCVEELSARVKQHLALPKPVHDAQRVSRSQVRLAEVQLVRQEVVPLLGPDYVRQVEQHSDGQENQ